MLRKVFIHNVFLLMLLGVSYAGDVTKESIPAIAKNWISNYHYLLQPPIEYGEISVKDEIIEIKDIDGRNTLAFIAQLIPHGFIIFTNDTRLKPVVGYSTERNVDLSNPEYNFLLDFIRQDIPLRLKAVNSNSAPLSLVQQNESDWDNLINGESQEPENPLDIIGPFVLSDWGQGYVSGSPVFNYYTPNQWPAGCVATVIAQILNYYKWPLQGTGSHGYTDNNTGYHYVNYGETIYDWENTLDIYNNVLFNLAQQQAAGLLTYHCCVSVDMDFEQNGSTAETADAPFALQNYFRHSGHYESVSASGFWTELANNIYDYRPAGLSISSTNGLGHAAVVDGYSETNGYFHLNPGWNGNYNGWYDVSGSWNMSGYTIVNGAVKGIVPSPMIGNHIMTDSLKFLLPWYVSIRQEADYYQLQQAPSAGGPWTTLGDNIADTVYQVEVNEVGTYYYRVRASRDNIWWDYSQVKKVELGSERQITFNVNMSNRPLQQGETVGVRGNISPLKGNENSPPFDGPDPFGVYSLTIGFDYDYVGDTLLYRFAVDTGSGFEIEGANRTYVITDELIQVLPIVYFNDITGVENNFEPADLSFSLKQNYPNPFNSSTVIEFQLPSASLITMALYNSLGELVLMIDKDTFYSAGNHTKQIELSNLDLPSGIYLFKFSQGFNQKSIKMVYMK